MPDYLCSLANLFMDILLFFTLFGCVNAMILLVWFKSKAFVEYMHVFMCEDFFHVADYVKATVDDPATSYPEYMVATYPSFITRLLSCPKCLAFQLSLWFNIPVFMLLHIIVHWSIWALYPASVLVTSYFSLFMYHLLNKMMKHE